MAWKLSKIIPQKLYHGGFRNQFRVFATNLAVILRQTYFFLENRPGPKKFLDRVGPARSQMAEISNTGQHYWRWHY